MAETSSFSSEVSLNVASEVKPFQSASIKMYVRADLTQLAKDNSSLEHRVMKKVNVRGKKTHNVSNFQLIIEDPWEKGKDSLLSIHFRPPFSVVPKMQTALTKKFLQLAFQANTEETSTFSVKNPQVSCENSSHTTLRLVNSPNEILVNKLSLYRKQMIFSSFFADSEASLGLQLYLGNFH